MKFHAILGGGDGADDPPGAMIDSCAAVHTRGTRRGEQQQTHGFPARQTAQPHPRAAAAAAASNFVRTQAPAARVVMVRLQLLDLIVLELHPKAQTW